ncbi:hypothetical protein G9A89_021172 [Geosiphon pyriformis]|nr:hypothetical protein G9A89_021172 [Geosiphon pyriformis]
MCGEIEFSDHVFTCSADVIVHSEVVFSHINLWKSLMGDHFSVSSSVFHTFTNASDNGIYAILCKEFVLMDWVKKAVSIFGDKKKAMSIVVEFVHYLADDHCEPVGSSAEVSGSVSTGLETHLNVKKNHLDTIYSCSASYKKTKKHVIGIMVDSFAGLLSLKKVGDVGIKPVVFWGSKVGSITSSVNDLSDVENMANTVAKETSYTESGEDDVLGSNGLPLRGSHTMEMWSFNLSKSFTLDIELSAVLDKNVGDKLICIIKSLFTSESSMNRARKLAIYEKIVVNNDLKKVSSHSDKEIIVKEILVDLPKSAVESVFSKFEKIISIKIQLIGLWQKALVEFESSEVADLVAAK